MWAKIDENYKILKRASRHRRLPMRYCACGCGEPVYRVGKLARYRPGHYAKAQARVKKGGGSTSETGQTV